jgi:hypothetical protein
MRLINSFLIKSNIEFAIDDKTTNKVILVYNIGYIRFFIRQVGFWIHSLISQNS